jgi:3-deoxy-7-phosphoheptulonate synthase
MAIHTETDMLIVMSQHATADDCARVVLHAETLGVSAYVISCTRQRAVALTTGAELADDAEFASLPGVASAVRVPTAYKLASRHVQPADTIVKIGRACVGECRPVFCGGPCAVESREQLLECAHAVKAAGADLLRGGAYKPRTSPYSFQGLREKGLELLAEARAETGLGIVTEALDVENFDLVEEYADCVQIGARNMQNFSLLRRAGRSHRPILLKRGSAATRDEFLMAAEYILSEGNPHVVLCERGVRTFADHTRNTLDLSIIPAVQRDSHLPIIVDPSHATGMRDYVHPMTLAAIAAGASGALIEVHPNPDRALSDGGQSVYPDQFAEIVRDCTAMAEFAARRTQHYASLSATRA